MKAQVREIEARAMIEETRARGFAAGVAFTVVLAGAGIGAAVFTGSGIEYGGGAAAAATTGLTLLRWQGRR